MVFELKNRPSPRSPSFTTPVAVMNTLAGLMSGGEKGGDETLGEEKRREVRVPLWENTFEFCFWVLSSQPLNRLGY